MLATVLAQLCVSDLKDDSLHCGIIIRAAAAAVELKH